MNLTCNSFRAVRLASSVSMGHTTPSSAALMMTGDDHAMDHHVRHRDAKLAGSAVVQSDILDGGCSIHEIAQDLFSEADKNGTGCVTLSELYTISLTDSPVRQR